MPRDGLTFAVRVGREIDFLDGLGGLFQLCEIFPPAFGLFILWSEIMFDIHAERAFGQIPDMSVGGFDDIILSENPPDGLGLGRRLHDDEFIRHIFVLHIRSAIRTGARRHALFSVGPYFIKMMLFPGIVKRGK